MSHFAENEKEILSYSLSQFNYVMLSKCREEWDNKRKKTTFNVGKNKGRVYWNACI